MPTLLEVVRAAKQELGLPDTNSVASSTDPDTRQMFGLVNRLGKVLAGDKDGGWRRLTRTQQYITDSVDGVSVTSVSGSVAVTVADTSSLAAGMAVINNAFSSDTYIVSVDSGTQLTLSQEASESATNDTTFVQTQYALPSDFLAQINMTHWDRNQHWEVLGPVTPQQWEYLKSGIVTTGPRLFYRLLGDYFQIFPLPSYSSSRIVYEYRSTNWVEASNGTLKGACTADTDEILFPENMFVLGLKAFYKQAKGMDYTGDYQLYLSELGKAKAQDQGAPVISLNGPSVGQRFLNWQNIPDSGYGR